MLEPQEPGPEAWTWKCVPADGRVALGWCNHPENVCSDGGGHRADQHQARIPKKTSNSSLRQGRARSCGSSCEERPAMASSSQSPAPPPQWPRRVRSGEHTGLSKRLPWVNGGSRPNCSELRGCGGRVNGDRRWTLLLEVWLLGL